MKAKWGVMVEMLYEPRQRTQITTRKPTKANILQYMPSLVEYAKPNNYALGIK